MPADAPGLRPVFDEEEEAIPLGFVVCAPLLLMLLLPSVLVLVLEVVVVPVVQLRCQGPGMLQGGPKSDHDGVDGEDGVVAGVVDVDVDVEDVVVEVAVAGGLSGPKV